MAFGCVLIIVLHLSSGADASEVTNVSTPSGSAHGGLVSGNIPCAIAANAIGDCGKTAPAGAIVGTSDTQTLTNKTIAGAQNTFSNIPDSALSTNVDLLNAAQSAGGLKTFSGGVALPSGSNPSGSNFYEDSNGNLHFVSPFMDAQIVGGKFAGDASRPWFLSPTGSGITETSSGQQPNWTSDRNEYYNGGSGLTFNTTTQTNVGKGWNVATTNDFSVGATSITVSANANIAVGQNVNGSCVSTGTTVSSYSLGTVGLSTGLACNLPSGSSVTFTPIANNAPGNAHNVGQYTLNSYTTGATGSGVALGSYAFGFGTGSSQILFGANILARDLSGRKSSVSRSGLLAAEFDLVASGPDDGVNRILQDWVFAENGPSADGATTFSAGARCRPSAANAQNTPNGIEIGYCFGATTMTSQPNGGNGQYGKIDKPFWADGCAISCFEIDGGSLTFQTSASASSGQPNLVFALGTSINPGQLVSGTSIPVGTTVTAVYQCELSQPLPGCSGATNETLVVLSANLTATVANNVSITFQATIPDGAIWSANFSKEFVNWTNTDGPGKIKAGTTGNLGTALTLTGIGEDSNNAVNIDYGDLNWVIDSNTHGSTLGHIGVSNAGFTVGSPTGGNQGVGSINAQTIYQNGSPLGLNAFTSTTFAPLANPSFTGTVTLPDGTICGASCTWASAIAMGNHGVTGASGFAGNNGSSGKVSGSAATGTSPTLIPNQSSGTTGIGAQAAGNLSLIASGTEIGRITTAGIVLESGAYLSGSTSGVTCSGAPTSSFASTNGIVTHC